MPALAVGGEAAVGPRLQRIKARPSRRLALRNLVGAHLVAAFAEQACQGAIASARVKDGDRATGIKVIQQQI